ncbi:hypothetical protein [Phenylobacterium koreense]|uniref:Lysozyme inhibitor n=1 Tax=Phenylobacterium koreense TaxID=266125 RepID=A0ABV2ENV3_9CAUL
MKKLVLTLVALAAMSGPAAAQVSCRTDAGRKVCHDVYGNEVTATKDVLGNTIWIDQYGETVTVRRDALGNRTATYSDGESVSVRRDVLGNTVVEDSQGKTATRCRVDLLGKARCRPN